MIRLVCFDLGGVIVRICRSWTEGCQAAGLDVRGDVDPLSLPSDGWRRVEAAYQTGRIDGRTYAQRCSALVDGLYSPEEIRRIYDAWILGEYDGVEQMILRIHEAGVHTAVLSNTSHEHWLHMRQYPAFRQLRNKHGSCANPMKRRTAPWRRAPAAVAGKSSSSTTRWRMSPPRAGSAGPPSTLTRFAPRRR